MFVAIPRVGGYRDAAELVTKEAPDNSAVLFSGTRVVEACFKTDQPIMLRFLAILHSTNFEKVKSIPIVAAVFGAEDTSTAIYRNISPSDYAPATDYQISLPIFARNIALKKCRFM